MSVIGHRRGGPPAGTEPFRGRPGSRRPLRRPSSRCSWQRCAASTGCSPAIMPGCSPGTAPSAARRPTPGDDPRHIDWAVTARTNDPHVRDTIADHELELWLVLDTSSSHAFRNRPVDQHELAWTAAGAFALLASRGGNRIGAVASGKGGRLIPARAGRAHTAAALTALRTPPADGDAGDLAKAIRLVRKTAKRRAW